MPRSHRVADLVLTLVVLLHLVITIFHGWAHSGAVVPMSRTATIFIWTVILVAPLVGVGLLWTLSIAGGAGAGGGGVGARLVFGGGKHFVPGQPGHGAPTGPARRNVGARRGRLAR